MRHLKTQILLFLFFGSILSLSGQTYPEEYLSVFKKEDRAHTHTVKLYIKRMAPSLSTTFAAGLFDGVKDALAHKYGRTVFNHWGWNDQFWNPDESWKNKYKNYPDDRSAKYFGSKTFLVGTTDAWHLAQTLELTSFTFSIMLYESPGKGKFWTKVLDFTLLKLAFSAGFHVSQALVVKN